MKPIDESTIVEMTRPEEEKDPEGDVQVLRQDVRPDGSIKMNPDGHGEKARIERLVTNEVQPPDEEWVRAHERILLKL